MPSTRARVHGRDEREARGIARPIARSHDRDVALFERLTQRFEALPRELGGFVEKEHAVMRESAISPGLGGSPPPTSPTALAV